MELKSQVCSLEIAKKLKELGVKQESLFFWGYDSNSGFSGGLMILQHSSYSEQYSAFTSAELGEMLPSHIRIKKRDYWLNIARTTHGWNVGYVSRNPDYSLLNDEEIIHATLSNSLSLMLIYLLENHLIILTS